MSDSVRPQRGQPTRLPHPWDSPGKNTGVGCHFLLQCMKVKSESEVAQLCPTPSDPMDCTLPGSSVHGICQARVLEWVAIAFSLRLSNFHFPPDLAGSCGSHSPLTNSSFSRKIELSWKIHLLPAPGDPASSPASPQPPQTDAAFTSWGSHRSLLVQEHLQTQTPGGLGCIH